MQQVIDRPVAMQKQDHAVGHDDHAHGHHDLEGMKVLGFWIFLASDLLIFACLFATYLVLRTHTDGGATAQELFANLNGSTIETFLLLTSSFTSGLAVLELRKGNVNRLIGWLVVTVLLGLGFVGMEINEFVAMVGEGATISRSAFLSAFFVLVGTHGAHVSLGLCWIIGLMFQLKRRGITTVTTRKVMVASLYWHFLDVVWVFLFTVVYLTGKVM
jgi:cytochrome o ubiquinol oxidase subunit III